MPLMPVPMTAMRNPRADCELFASLDPALGLCDGSPALGGGKSGCIGERIAENEGGRVTPYVRRQASPWRRVSRIVSG
jgi:hypothetical protein